jgi:spore germination protein KC
MVISQRIAKLGLTKITDYFIRDNNLTTNFYVVLTDDIPQKILNYQDTMKNINAETITKLITNSNANITLTKKNQLDFLMAQIKDNKQDIVLPNININNDLEITNLGVFKNDKINYYLNNDELNTYALLKNMKNNNILIENEQGSIKIYQEKTTINYLNNEFIIKINLRGKIEDLKENINVKDVNNINKLENNFQENIQNDVIKLIQESLNNDSDILGFKKVLALKKVNADWHQPYQVKVSLKLNRIGGLFEVIE